MSKREEKKSVCIVCCKEFYALKASKKKNLCSKPCANIFRKNKETVVTATDLYKRSIITKKGCWEWNESLDKDGYGRISIKAKYIRVHRLMWQLNNYPITKEVSVCHVCDNRKCINPNHLWVGSHQDNMADMMNKRKKVLEFI